MSADYGTGKRWNEVRNRFLSGGISGALVVAGAAAALAAFFAGTEAAVIAAAVWLVPVSVFLTIGFRWLRRQYRETS